MQAWPAPGVPRLPGRGTAPRLYDTASRALAEPAPGPLVRLYVCGITPYDATHLGHAATYVAFDLLVRAWRDAGHDVRYTQNVTDVDDPLLQRATATGEDWRELADRQTELFRGDMAALRVLPPDDYVGAVEAIPMIGDVIERLRARGAAYDVDGDLYFPVGADPSFGSVARLSGKAMLAAFGEHGGDPSRSGKKDPLDCLLWQRESAGEPAWDSALGRGRPGWHVECTAIALAHLGMGFDVQGGGSDLAFPHHEMSAAQAQALTGIRPFAQAYVHAGMVGLDGAKMSKSKGNLVLVSRLHADGHDPMAVRLALLAHHYRSDWDWTHADLEDAQRRLDRWRRASEARRGPDAAPLLAAVRRCLSEDLDAPGALAAVDRWAEQVARGPGSDPDAPRHVAAVVDALLGVRLR